MKHDTPDQDYEQVKAVPGALEEIGHGIYL